MSILHGEQTRCIDTGRRYGNSKTRSLVHRRKRRQSCILGALLCHARRPGVTRCGVSVSARAFVCVCVADRRQGKERKKSMLCNMLRFINSVTTSTQTSIFCVHVWHLQARAHTVTQSRLFCDLEEAKCKATGLRKITLHEFV